MNHVRMCIRMLDRHPETCACAACGGEVDRRRRRHDFYGVCAEIGTSDSENPDRLVCHECVRLHAQELIPALAAAEAIHSEFFYRRVHETCEKQVQDLLEGRAARLPL